MKKKEKKEEEEDRIANMWSANLVLYKKNFCQSVLQKINKA